METLRKLEDVLAEEARDLYSAENQIMKALPKMAKKASSESLKAAFQEHLSETEQQIARLEKIGKIMQIKLSGKVCEAMKGLLEEGEEILKNKQGNPALIDALMIGAAQRVEHYEISGYGTARAIAETLGLDDVVSLLQQSLDEESATDEKLTEISESEVLPECHEQEASAGEGEEEEHAPRRRSPGRKPSGASAR